MENDNKLYTNPLNLVTVDDQSEEGAPFGVLRTTSARMNTEMNKLIFYIMKHEGHKYLSLLEYLNSGSPEDNLEKQNLLFFLVIEGTESVISTHFFWKGI